MEDKTVSYAKLDLGLAALRVFEPSTSCYLGKTAYLVVPEAVWSEC
jgi:hypothetical protein